jgi:negative regulator of genetic competence, sporulation and motility
LFFFEKLDFLLEVCKRLTAIDSELKGDAFYLEGKGYYLIIELNTDKLEEYGLPSLDEYSFILEFGTAENIRERAPYLCEYAKRICKGNAIKTLGAL